jgi:redox-sensing transcriptional repressor
MHYHYFVGAKLSGREKIVGLPKETVSSAEIAEFLKMDDTLVRKDLAAIGVRGYPRVGFRSAEVLQAIRGVLGFDSALPTAIVGCGRLGGALAAYSGFAEYGVRIVAAFDDDPLKHGAVTGQVTIQPLENLETLISANGIRMAILTVPPEPAQALCDRLVAAGVEAIWNFAATTLSVPEHVVVRHEHISVGLAELAYHLKRRLEDDQEAPPPAAEA